MANYIIGAIILMIIALAIKHVIKNKGGCNCSQGCSSCHDGVCSTDKK